MVIPHANGLFHPRPLKHKCSIHSSSSVWKQMLKMQVNDIKILCTKCGIIVEQSIFLPSLAILNESNDSSWTNHSDVSKIHPPWRKTANPIFCEISKRLQRTNLVEWSPRATPPSRTTSELVNLILEF